MSEQVWASLFTTILAYLNFHSCKPRKNSNVQTRNNLIHNLCSFQEPGTFQNPVQWPDRGQWRAEWEIHHCTWRSLLQQCDLDVCQITENRVLGWLHKRTLHFHFFFFYHMRLMPRYTAKLHEEDCSNMLMAWRTQGRNMPSKLTAEAHLFKDSESADQGSVSFRLSSWIWLMHRWGKQFLDQHLCGVLINTFK